MSTLSTERVDILTSDILEMSTPIEPHVKTGFQVECVENRIQPESTQGVDVVPEFVGAKKAATLLGIDQRSVNRNCGEGKYEGATKTLIAGGEAWQIPVASLPPRAQIKMAEEVKAQLAARIGLVPTPKVSPALAQGEYTTLWEGYERSGETVKRMAENALDALIAFLGLVDAGYSKGNAEQEIQTKFGVDRVTVWRYRQACRRAFKFDHLCALNFDQG